MKIFCFLFIFSFILLNGCTHVKLKNSTREELLKSTIVNNIKIPFLEADTLIYLPERTSSTCGNSPKRWNRRYYAPHLESSSYKDFLLSKYPGSIIFAEHGNYLEESDTSRLHQKVFMQIVGYIYKQNKVEITESYYYIDKSYLVQRLYMFENNKWNHIITYEEGN